MPLPHNLPPLSGIAPLTPDGTGADVSKVLFEKTTWLFINKRNASSGDLSGAAGGDLSGTYPNPSVVALQGNAVEDAAPADGDLLTWVAANSRWEPTAPPATPGAITIDSHTLSAPTTNIVSSVLPAPAGGFLAVMLLQDATGGRLVTWDTTSFLLPPAGGLGLSTLANTYSVLLFIAISAKWLGGVLFTGRL